MRFASSTARVCSVSQVEPDRRDGRLQLVRDGVDERVVLFVAADLAHQKDGVQHDAADDHGQQQHAQEQQNAVRQLSSTQPMYSSRMTEISPAPSAMKNAIDFRRPATTMTPAYAGNVESGEQPVVEV